MGNSFAGAVFPDGIPDLPGNGNTLDVPPSVEEAKPQLSNGLAIPPALIARMHGLEPAKQRQLFAHFIRVQQEQLRRQQPQQTQQLHTAPSQTLGSLGMSIPPNPYSAVAGIPAGLHVSALGVSWDAALMIFVPRQILMGLLTLEHITRGVGLSTMRCCNPLCSAMRRDLHRKG